MLSAILPHIKAFLAWANENPAMATPILVALAGGLVAGLTSTLGVLIRAFCDVLIALITRKK